MPLPTPIGDESQGDFIDRCMGNPTMNDDFPDNKQRLAVCHNQWKQAKKGRDMPELTTKHEFRVLEQAELRLDDEGEVRTLRGYAAVWDAMSQPIFGFREIIRRGAFRKTIRDADVRALLNHDSNLVLGRKSARTLSLFEDEKGLSVKIPLPDTSYARDLMVSVERGDVNQMSFGFRAIKDRWTQPTAESKDLPMRELLEVQLFDVSVVTFPAYPQTEVHVRALMDAMLWKLGRGDQLSTEERGIMAAALDNVKGHLLAEPGGPHSDQPEPGQPHSFQVRRLRLLELVPMTRL